MNIQSYQLRAATRRAAKLPRQILKAPPLDYIPEVKRTAFLGEGGARPSATELERIIGSNDLALEFPVTAEWKHRQVKLTALEKLAGLVKFPAAYHKADQA